MEYEGHDGRGLRDDDEEEDEEEEEGELYCIEPREVMRGEDMFMARQRVALVGSLANIQICRSRMQILLKSNSVD